MTAIVNKHDVTHSGFRPANLSVPERDTPALNFLDDGNQYVLDCISDLEGMSEIGQDWKNLEHDHGEAYIYFQSFDWCYQWCKIFSCTGNSNSDPVIRVFTLRRNNALVMVWPLMETRSRGGLNNLTFLTEPLGQYGNIVCNRKLVSVDIGRRVWAHIHKISRVDAITLDQYPKSSILSEIIGNNGIIENSTKHSSVLQLSEFENWDEYKSSLSRNERKRRNQRKNKLARCGKVDYEVHYGDSPKYRELVELALQWKIVWLNETGRRASILSQESTKKFLSNLPGSQNGENLPTGSVLGALTLDGVPIGIEIGMCLDGHYYSYLGAFDWNYKKLSPGKMQIERAQEWAKNVNLKKFDFLGDPADYKTSWTDTEGELESRSFPLNARGYFYCAIWKASLRPFVRTYFNKLEAKHRNKLISLMGLILKGKEETPDAGIPIAISSNSPQHSSQCTVEK